MLAKKNESSQDNIKARIKSKSFKGERREVAAEAEKDRKL
jgi:hypothetical protein